MSYRVCNFVDCDPVSVSVSEPHGNVPATVSIVQSVGGMHFQHSMRYDQARQLGAYLMTLADKAEKMQTLSEVVAA